MKQTQKSKEGSTERELDKELDMTFPASDPLAITQPHRTKKPGLLKKQISQR